MIIVLQKLFIGEALRDREPTIIHHFAFHEDPNSFAYPNFMSCFLISFPLLHRLMSPFYFYTVFHKKGPFLFFP